MNILAQTRLFYKNTQYLFLYSEGGFIKLYEHSAFLFHTHVKDFKLSCRFIKTVNRFVVSLGFPANSLEKWLGRYPIRQVNEKLQVCDFGHKVDEVEYHNWFELARSLANPADKYTRQTSLIEKQPVYKTVYDQYLDILRLSKNFARHIRIPLGDDTKMLLHLICRSVRQIYKVQDRTGLIDEIQTRCDHLMMNYQALCDLHQIKEDKFALLSEGIVSVRNQLEGLRRTVKA